MIDSTFCGDCGYLIDSNGSPWLHTVIIVGGTRRTIRRGRGRGGNENGTIPIVTTVTATAARTISCMTRMIPHDDDDDDDDDDTCVKCSLSIIVWSILL